MVGDLQKLSEILADAIELTGERPTDQIRKSAQDYVTNIDLKLDAYLLERLPEVCDVPVLSEERAVTAPAGTKSYWIVDPLDGTSNFIANIPVYAISVALVDESGPLLAGVCSGLDKSIWTAKRDEGAYLNGERLSLAENPASDLLVLSTGILDLLMRGHEDAFGAIRSVGKVRNIGSQALHLCFVGGGQFCAVASKEAKIWDEAAGGLIAREAGAVWQSEADHADWSDPARLMGFDQFSITAHPQCFEQMKNALEPVFEEAKAAT